jgi:hypothetical protein
VLPAERKRKALHKKRAQSGLYMAAHEHMIRPSQEFAGVAVAVALLASHLFRRLSWCQLVKYTAALRSM